MDEQTSEPDRYASAAGWNPYAAEEAKEQRDLDQARERYESIPQDHDTLLATRPASKWILPKPKLRPHVELLSSLWRTGEIAVMFGERSVGKSIFAVQIADAIAKGNSPLNAPKFYQQRRRSKKGEQPPPSVLYLDFELSAEQFSRRYCTEPSETGERIQRPRFAFDRAVIADNFYMPDVFRNLGEFLSHSIGHAAAARRNGVVIIDSIHYLLRNATSNVEALNLMKTLRRMAADYSLSILITAPMRTRRNALRPIALKDLGVSRHVAELADTVFALGQSTAAPQYRYLKHIASRHAPILQDAHQVLALELATGEVQAPKSNAPRLSSKVQGPMSNVQGQPLASDSPARPFSSSPLLPDSSTPPPLSSSTPHFLFHGPTPEHYHITKPLIIERQPRRSRYDDVINMYLNPAYGKYLKGER